MSVQADLSWSCLTRRTVPVSVTAHHQPVGSVFFLMWFVRRPSGCLYSLPSLLLVLLLSLPFPLSHPASPFAFLHSLAPRLKCKSGLCDSPPLMWPVSQNLGLLRFSDSVILYEHPTWWGLCRWVFPASCVGKQSLGWSGWTRCEASIIYISKCHKAGHSDVSFRDKVFALCRHRTALPVLSPNYEPETAASSSVPDCARTVMLTGIVVQCLFGQSDYIYYSRRTT